MNRRESFTIFGYILAGLAAGSAAHINTGVRQKKARQGITDELKLIAKSPKNKSSERREQLRRELAEHHDPVIERAQRIETAENAGLLTPIGACLFKNTFALKNY